MKDLLLTVGILAWGVILILLADFIAGITDKVLTKIVSSLRRLVKRKS